ncbi:jg24306 [Pararge aegeria aegeria]|uniref:Jg24306 protein n=1 Tax=Pararge aegeria aegeria TaxID=348720 RepID=A0A8S4SCP7_9NEOP|nr:jg24306 [Pararge aegeria aegeria]
MVRMQFLLIPDQWILTLTLIGLDGPLLVRGSPGRENSVPPRSSRAAGPAILSRFQHHQHFQLLKFVTFQLFTLRSSVFDVMHFVYVLP